MEITAKEAYQKSFKVRFPDFTKIMEKIDSKINSGCFEIQYSSLIEYDIFLKLEKLGYEIKYNDKDELVIISWAHFKC